MMHTITVRGRDTVAALQEVEEKLGDSAMIISTRKRDGFVEIEAAAETFVTPQKIQAEEVAALISVPSAVEDAPQPMFTRSEGGLSAVDLPATEPEPERKVHANFAEYLEEQEALQGISQEREEIVEVERTPGNDPLSGWSSLSPEFCDELRSDLASIEKNGHALGFLGQVKRQVLTRDVAMIENARRVIVVGASGAGKSLVAAKIAAHMMTHDANCRPVFTLANAQGRSAGALLNDKAQLMNIKMQTRSLDELNSPVPPVDAPEIIEVHGSSAEVQLVVEALANEKGTQVVIALPAGMHPRAASRVCAQWQKVDPVVVMTRLDDWLPTAEDMAVFLANGTRLAWVTQGESILDAFDHPNADTVCGWARSWLQDAAQ